MATLAALNTRTVFIKADADPKDKDAYYIVVRSFDSVTGTVVVKQLNGGAPENVTPASFGSVSIYTMAQYRSAIDPRQRI